MDGGDGAVGIVGGDEHGDLDFAGGNHLDVDIGVGQGLEHAGGHALVGFHPGAHHRDFGHAGIVGNASGPDLIAVFLLSGVVVKLVKEYFAGEGKNA